MASVCGPPGPTPSFQKGSLASVSAFLRYSCLLIASRDFFLVDTRTQCVNSLCNADPFWDVHSHLARLSPSLTRHVCAPREPGGVPRTRGDSDERHVRGGGRRGYAGHFVVVVWTNLSPARLQVQERGWVPTITTWNARSAQEVNARWTMTTRPHLIFTIVSIQCLQ